MKKIYLILSFCLIHLMTQAQIIPAYVPTNGLVGWWPFNGNANDESGNGHNGAVNGCALANDRFGNSFSAYIFNGVTDFIRINDVLIPGTATSYTFSFWIKPDTAINSCEIISDRYGSNCGHKYRFRLNNNQINFPK